jgi:hypothetical protein
MMCGEEETYWNFCGHLREKVSLEDLDVDGNVIFKLVFNKFDGT